MNKQILPSAQSAIDWIDGKPWASVPLIRDLLGRAVIVAMGLYLSGVSEDVLKKGIAGALAIEFFVVVRAAQFQNQNLELKQ